MRFPCATVSLCVLPLLAQDPSAEAFLARLADTRQGAVVVVGPSDFAQVFQDLKDQEPLVTLLLKPERPTGATLEALQRHFGWGPGPRWAWLGRDGRVKAEGTSLPGPEDLQARLLEAGWQDRGRDLEAHRRADPSGMNAWPERFHHELQVAQRRMEPLLLPKQATEPLWRLRRPLNPEEEDRIWGRVAEALEALFRDGTWAQGAIGRPGFRTSLSLLPAEAGHAPRLRSICARQLPRLEAALLRSPDPVVLEAWGAVSRVAGQGDLLALLPRIPPSPLEGESAWRWAMTTTLWRPLLETCRRTGTWQSLVDGLAQELADLEDPELLPQVRERLWTYSQPLAQALLEGTLASRGPGEVERRVGRWASLGLKDAPALGAQVAQSGGAPDLARVLQGLEVAPPPPRREALGRLLAGSGRPRFLVLGGGTLEAACLALAQDEAWHDLDLASLPLTGVAQQVAAELGRPAGSRWLVVSAGGKVLGEGTSAPTLEALAQVLREAGQGAPRARLRAFLQRHPDHLGARWALLRLEAEQAARRMASFLEPEGRQPLKAEAEGGATFTVVPPLRRLRTPLTATEDLRLWGAVARAWEALMAEEGWAALSHPVELPAVAALSPLMQQAAARVVSGMETQLAKAPFGAGGLWRLWANAALVAGDRDPRAFLDSLRPLPALGTLPPGMALDPILRGLRTRQRWEGLIALLGRDRQESLEAGSQAPSQLFQGTWEARLGPLLEAHLRLGQVAEAEALLRQIHARYGAQTLPARAAAVALACGRRDLALQWSAWRFAASKR